MQSLEQFREIAVAIVLPAGGERAAKGSRNPGLIGQAVNPDDPAVAITRQLLVNHVAHQEIERADVIPVSRECGFRHSFSDV